MGVRWGVMIRKTSPEPERYRFANSRFDGETRLGEISRDLLYPDHLFTSGNKRRPQVGHSAAKRAKKRRTEQWTLTSLAPFPSDNTLPERVSIDRRMYPPSPYSLPLSSFSFVPFLSALRYSHSLFPTRHRYCVQQFPV